MHMDASKISNGSFGAGATGTLSVRAGDLVMIHDARLFSQTSEGVPGGDIFIDTASLTLIDGGAISNRGYIRAYLSGDIRINASESIFIQGRAEPQDPNPGSNVVSTGIFSFFGDISVTSPEVTLLDSGRISTRTYNDSPAGTLDLASARLYLGHGAQLNVESFGNSYAIGPAGLLRVDASERIEMEGVAGGRTSGLRAGTRSSGDAGIIEITAPDIVIRDGAQISVSTGVFGTGSAGRVNLRGERLQIADSGGIVTQSRGHASGGGDILISAEQLRLNSHAMISSRTTDRGNAGAIQLNISDQLVASDSEITTSAEAAGGGVIQLNADVFLRDASIDLDASSNVAGNDGRVEINSPTLDLSRGIAVLTSAIPDAAALLDNPCLARARQGRSSLYIATPVARDIRDDYLLSGSLAESDHCQP